jgi:hypothetical protein
MTAVPLPPCPVGGPRRDALTGSIVDWLDSVALVDLVRCFGGVPPAGPPDRVLAELDEFSARVWDFRDGGERGDARPAEFPSEVDELVRTAARGLGLTGRTVPPGEYDHVLILGGGPRTALARAHFAAQLCGGATVWGLTCRRPLNPSERAFAPDARTEADAMRAALDSTVDGRLVVAEPSRPGMRANTTDTYHAWAAARGPSTMERLLLVTTDLYVPYQHCDAVRVLGLGHGYGVDTVGLDPARYPDLLVPTTTAKLLQEIRSAIRAMRALCAA